MNRKKWLLRLTVLLMLAGISACFVPFAHSWRPNVRAEQALWEVDASQFRPGDFRIFHQEHPRAWGVDLLVLRDFDNALYVYWLPTHQGQVAMPDFQWFRWYYDCKDFGPDEDRGHLQLGGGLHCKDTPNYDSNNLRWSYAGMSQVPYFADMVVPPYILKGERLLVRWQQG